MAHRPVSCLGDDAAAYEDLQWSPDGRYLTTTRDANATTTQIRLVDVQTGQETPGRLRCQAASLSPEELREAGRDGLTPDHPSRWHQPGIGQLTAPARGEFTGSNRNTLDWQDPFQGCQAGDMALVTSTVKVFGLLAHSTSSGAAPVGTVGKRSATTAWPHGSQR